MQLYENLKIFVYKLHLRFNLFSRVMPEQENVTRTILPANRMSSGKTLITLGERAKNPDQAQV
mgnify:CR=1 FL=1